MTAAAASFEIALQSSLEQEYSCSCFAPGWSLEALTSAAADVVVAEIVADASVVVAGTVVDSSSVAGVVVVGIAAAAAVDRPPSS